MTTLKNDTFLRALLRQPTDYTPTWLMRQAGLQGISRRKRGCTRRNPADVPAEDLVGRRFHPEGPDRLWVADITEHPTRQGKVYAAVVIDAVTRLLPGVLGDEQSAAQDSFTDGLLDCQHYTRPEEIEGLAVPPVLRFALRRINTVAPAGAPAVVDAVSAAGSAAAVSSEPGRLFTRSSSRGVRLCGRTICGPDTIRYLPRVVTGYALGCSGGGKPCSHLPADGPTVILGAPPTSALRRNASHAGRRA